MYFLVNESSPEPLDIATSKFTGQGSHRNSKTKFHDFSMIFPRSIM